MASRQLRILIQHLRRCVCRRGEDMLSDAQLLERWNMQRDEAAFEVLLWRHGAMVLAVCRRLLRDSHDIEDAFQAAFLTLVRKGQSIRRPEALAAWLYRVAYRIALRLRGEAAERARREQVGVETLPSTEADEIAARDLRAVVDEEIDALPERYRQAFVLCCLEGKTHAEAAQLLGRPTGPVSCWLKRGRERLRDRLVRRGLTPTALATVGESEARAVLPAVLVKSTERAAIAFTMGAEGGAVMISARVAALVDAAVRGTAATKPQWTLVLGLMLGLTATGAGMWVHQPHAKQGPAKQEAKAPEAEPLRKREEPSARTDRYGDPLPEGVISRLGTSRLRAVGARTGLSSDGKTIITVTRGRLLKFWDADTGKLREKRELPIQLSDECFLSSNGRLLAVRERVSDSPLDIWDVVASKRLHRLRMPQGATIYRAKFSPDGKMLSVVEYGPPQSIVRLWDMASGDPRELKWHQGRPHHLTFSPDSRILAASDDHRIICWNIATGKTLWQTKCEGIPFAFTPDSQKVITSPGYGERAWQAWDAATGKPSDGLQLPEGYFHAHFAVAPDGRTLVFAQARNIREADGHIRLWDLRTGKLLHTLDADGGIGPFFPDGKSLLTNDGSLQRWELATGRPLFPVTEKLGHRAEVRRAVYSPDGRRLTSAADDGTVRLWDVATAKPLHLLRGRDRDATDLAFTPDGRFLVSGGWGWQGELYVWDTETGKEVRSLPLHDPKRGENRQHVWKLHVTPNGKTVFVLGYDPSGRPELPGILSQWDLTTGERMTRVETGRSDGFYSGFSPDGRILASRGDLLDTARGKVRVKLAGGPEYCPHYAFTSDGRRVAGLITRTVSEGKRISTKTDGIRIWDSATGRVLRRLSTIDSVGQLAFSPDGCYVAATDLRGLRLWELASGKVVLRHKAHEHMRGSYPHSFASCLSFAPDGRTLATGHFDSTILIWNLVPAGHLPISKDLPRLWEDLIDMDAARAYAASWRLADAPKDTIPYLRTRLQPVSPASAEQVRPLLADLDSDEFAKREAAAARLRELDDRAAGFLKEAIKGHPSLEMRRRVQELLKTLEKPPSGETLRTLRAMAVLERIGTAEARQILNMIAQGMPEARVTREAKAALERLTARHPTEKH